MRISVISTSFSNMALFQSMFDNFGELYEASFLTLSEEVSSKYPNFKKINMKSQKSYISFLDKYKPDYVICDLSNYVVNIGGLLKECTKRQVKTIALIERFNNKHFQLNPYPDIVLTSNLEVKQEVSPHTKVMMYDNHFINYAKHCGISYDKAISFDNPKVLYISQNKRLFYGYFILSEFRSLIPINHKIYVKTHYRDKINQWRRVVKNVEVLPQTLTSEVVKEMLSCDLIIGDDSELLIMGASLGIPTIFSDDNMERHITDFFTNGKFKRGYIPSKYTLNTNRPFLEVVSCIFHN